MKISVRVIILVLSVFISVACNPGGNHKPSELQVFDLAKAFKTQETGYASEFFEEVKIQVLEGDKEWSFPSDMVNARFYKHHSLFYEMRNNESIAVFGDDGKLVLVLNKKGNGPGEYAGVSGVGMNPKEDRVYVHESYRKKLHWYDLKGSWLESIDLPTRCRNLMVLENGDIIIQNIRYKPEELDPYRLFLTNAQGRFKNPIWEKSRDIDDYGQHADPFCLRITGLGQMYYRDSPKYDTIYSVSEDYKLSPIYVMDVGNEESIDNIPGGLSRLNEGTDNLKTRDYFISQNNLVIAGYYKKWVHFKVNLANESIKCYDNISDDLIGYKHFPKTQTQDGKYLVHMLYVNYGKNNIDNLFEEVEVKFPNIQEQLKDEVLHAADNQQVILLFYKVKQ